MGKSIDFEQIYGTALGVQKYTITHGSDVSSSIETITEFWLQKGNGKETQIKLSGDNIKVREGQQVSLIRAYNYSGAYTKSKTSPFGRVDARYYPGHLSVKSGRATFTAPSFRCSQLALLLMCL